MQPGPTPLRPYSYAAQAAASRANTRPKSDYCLAMEAKQRRSSRSTLPESHPSFSAPLLSSTPSTAMTPERMTSPRVCCGARESQKFSQLMSSAHTRSGKAPTLAQPQPSTSPCSSARQRGSAPKNAPLQENIGSEMLTNEEMNDSTSVLLTQLQHVVVQISGQIVEERRHAWQLQDQVDSLKNVVAEQDAMLDRLSRENELMQQEKVHMWRSHQQELRLSAEAPPRGSPERHKNLSVHTQLPSLATASISAAEVDRCVLAEFDRLPSPFPPPAGGSDYERKNPFDEVSPAVATVLRSLATQVLQHRQPTTRGLDYSGREWRDVQDRGVRRVSDEASVESFSPTHRLPTKDQEKLKVGPARTISSSATHPSQLATQSYRVTTEGLSENRTGASSRAHSESSASVASAIYEEAGTILSDIRARYGL
ncbi:hypothetical protein ABL78_7692 [Leptomonas seymouri]|uniref:Uncharacterized protein n=1 Tax=Leptomonas seymouri TaxID=5684 RepID=A0A0N1HZ64_LEPSE|nr:hypothetical protein ABL78_7692 [Leptomonas seymouri]|eukprot:KPI83278.1 hypothetical protein ABL78_7692 [Leptomonas seymouri]